MDITFEQVEKRFGEYSTSPQAVHIKIKGVIIGLLDKACGSKDNRYQFSVTLGMKPHSSDWTDGQWWALYQMCKPDKVDEFGNPDSVKGKWCATNEHFQEIVDCVMRKIADNPLQMPLMEDAKNTAEEFRDSFKTRSDEIKRQMGFYND